MDTDPGYLPIHPSAAGHEHLAWVLAPLVASVLRP
jgi:hypothetical protein